VMEDYTSSNGHRFKRIPRQMFAANPELEPLVLHVKLLDLLVCIFKPILELSIQVNASLIRRAVFSLDAPSASVCLLIQLEKPATEEGGVTASVYSRKEPVSQGSLSCLNGVVSPVHRAYCQVYWARHAFQAFDFRMMTRNEPFSQLFHYLYVYPLTVSLSRKRNLFIKVEMRKDDADIRKQPLEVCLDEADFVTIGYAVLPLSTHIQ
ncbi:hypothetical protein BHM03_00031014, partial [Ensete ventricosum]